MNSQEQIIQEQDNQIDDIGKIVKRIKNNTGLINNELDKQAM